MSKTKFTPGPWIIETYHDSLFKICKPDFKIGDEVSHRLTADAALISAAPEMFEALNAVTQLLLEQSRKSHLFAGQTEIEMREINEIQGLAKQALKKARGEK